LVLDIYFGESELVFGESESVSLFSTSFLINIDFGELGTVASSSSEEELIVEDLEIYCS